METVKNFIDKLPDWVVVVVCVSAWFAGVVINMLTH